MSDLLTELARFVCATRWEDLGPSRPELARARLLDSVACAVTSRDNEVTQRALQLSSGQGCGAAESGATLWLAGRRGTVAEAAFHNSLLAHAILHEDVGQGGHPGANVVPAALSMAEAEGSAGSELLTAIAVGYEVQARMGSHDLLHAVGDRGLRGTTATGAFGAAAACARLMRLTEAQAKNALAFAASLCVPGIEEPILVGSDERSLQVATNSRAGVHASQLARAGFSGASSALDGRCGFFAAYTGVQGDSTTAGAGLGSEWVSDSVVAKPYPTAGWNVGPIFAALAVGPVDLHSVDRIEVLHTWWGRNTAYIHPGPFATMEQALISCPFAVASALTYGRYDWEIVKQAFVDPNVARLARLVRVDGVATWGFTDGELTVHRRDGSRSTASAADMPARLIHPTWSDVVEKFERMTASFLSTSRREQVVAVVGALDGAASSAELAALLGTEAGVAAR